MISKNFITAVLTIALFQRDVSSVCMPCPQPGVTVYSTTNCACSLPKFYDEVTETCVAYSQCPVLPPRELKKPKNPVTSARNVSSEVESSSSRPQIAQILKDMTVVQKTIQRRLQIVKRRMPHFLKNFFRGVLHENKDLFKSCRGNMICVVQEIMKKNSNNIDLAKVRSLRDEVDRSLYEVFDDLEDVLKEKCLDEECLLIKVILMYKRVIPERLEEFKDLEQILTFFIKYFLKDFKKDLENRNGLIKQTEKSNVTSGS